MQGKMIYTEILMPNAPGQESYTRVQNKIAQYELHAMKHRSLSKQHYQVFVCILVNNLSGPKSFPVMHVMHTPCHRLHPFAHKFP